MRVWIDMTAPAHVLVFRPLVDLLRARGDEVEITARDYAQTVELLELHGLDAELLGRHGGRSRFAKLGTMATRLRRFGPGRRGASSTSRSRTARTTSRWRPGRSGFPSGNTFDYEFAMVQHQLGCRAATRVLVPEAIPPERLERYGVRPPKLRRTRA